MLKLANTTIADIRRVSGEFRNLEKQQAFANRVAITRLSARVANAEREEIPRVFDKPTPTTQRSVLNVQRNMQGGGYVRVVQLRDIAEKYLAPQIEGGDRANKPFERAFRFVDFVDNQFRDRRMFAVPGRGAQLNAYGNVPASRIVRILSGIGKAEATAGFDQNVTEKSRKRNSKRAQYFMGKAGPGRRTFAIWERTGVGRRGIKPIFVAVPKVTYNKRFDFYGIGERLVAKEHASEYERALDEAIRTARS